MKSFNLRSRICVILALLVIVFSVSSVFAATYIPDGKWKLEKVSVSGDIFYYVHAYNGDENDIRIPALCSVDNKPIIKINNNTFLNKTNLANVFIPATIQTIGQNAFYGCSSLESITIPSDVSEIGPNAFYGCTSLTTLEFKSDSALKMISHNTFNGCTSLTSVELPEGLTTISAKAFLGCSQLQNITIGPYVTEIEDDSFKSCNNLTIYGWSDTYAQQYAADKKIPFVSLGDYEYPTEPSEPTESTATVNTAPSGSIPTATEPVTGTTAPDPTESTTKYPVGKKYIIGDSDLSGTITVKDATLIQKYAAGLAHLDNIQIFLANCNSEGGVNVKDATQIQKHCAGFKNMLFVGTEVEI